MDDYLVGTHVNPADEGEKDDPLPQWRHPSPTGGVLVRAGDYGLLQLSRTGLSRREDLEEARRLREQPANSVHND